MTVGGAVQLKMIYIDSSWSWNIDIDGYCETETLRMTAKKVVAKL
jgi:hypothetical protein